MEKDLPNEIDIFPQLELATHIYSIGYTLSLIALSLGLAVFLHFKWVLFHEIFIDYRILSFFVEKWILFFRSGNVRFWIWNAFCFQHIGASLF